MPIEPEDMSESTQENEESAPEERGAKPANQGGPEGPARTSTHQEVAYLRKLIEDHVPVKVKIRGGQLVSGIIEYYDASFIRLTREEQGEPNLFIFKKDIVYLEEGTAAQ